METKVTPWQVTSDLSKPEVDKAASNALLKRRGYEYVEKRGPL